MFGQNRMTQYDKIAILLYESQNIGGEINLCDICYYKDTDLCDWKRPYCINGVALKLKSEVKDG